MERIVLRRADGDRHILTAQWELSAAEAEEFIEEDLADLGVVDFDDAVVFFLDSPPRGATVTDLKINRESEGPVEFGVEVLNEEPDDPGDGFLDILPAVPWWERPPSPRAAGQYDL